MDGVTDMAASTCIYFGKEPDAEPLRLIVRRVRPTPGSQLPLIVDKNYCAFSTDRGGDTLQREVDHREDPEMMPR